MQEQVDSVADLELAAIRGLDEMTGVEDGRRKRTEASHHEIRWRVLGLLNEVRDLAVLVRVTDPVPGGVFQRYFLNEKRDS